MTNKITIITGLFDINRGTLDGMFARSFDLYLGWFKQLLNTINLPMVIYCEKSLNTFINEKSKDHEVVIYNRTLDDIRQFPFYEQVQKIRTSNKWKNQAWWLPRSPQASLELYDPLVMSKQFWVDEVTRLNPFNTDYFLWLDAGIFNTVNADHFKPPFPDNIIPHMNKMLYLAFSYRDREVHGFDGEAFDGFAGTKTEYVVRATLWGSTGEVIRGITPLYSNLLEQTLKSGYMGTEENIFTLISYLYPDKVNLFFVEKGFVRYFLERI